MSSATPGEPRKQRLLGTRGRFRRRASAGSSEDFRLLILEAGPDDLGASAWRRIAETFAALEGVEVVRFGAERRPAHAGRTKNHAGTAADAPVARSCGLRNLDDTVTKLAELDAARRFDAILVPGYAMAARLAAMEKFRGRVVTHAGSFPSATGSAAVEAASVASASGVVLCDTEDQRSRFEARLPAASEATMCWPGDAGTDQAHRLIQRLRPAPPTVLRNRKLKVVVAGHELKFMAGIVRWLVRLDECEVRIDRWRGLNPPLGRPSIRGSAWADVVVCEWCGRNAVWYSRHKRRGQRLVVHLHRTEIDTEHPYEMKADAVDQIVTVSPAYRDVVRKRLTAVPAHRVVAIPNYADSAVFVRPKLPGAHLHLGLIGAIPKLKRLDLALDVLTAVRRRDDRFCLFVKSAMPWELPFVWNRPDERKYYRRVFRRIQTEPLLEGAVVFDGFGSDVANWLRKIGTVLSTSDLETFGVSVLEAMMSGAVGVILPWPGAGDVYGEPWVVPDADAAAERILGAARSRDWQARSAQATGSVACYDLDRVFEAWAAILVEDRDPEAWV